VSLGHSFIVVDAWTNDEQREPMKDRVVTAGTDRGPLPGTEKDEKAEGRHVGEPH
jgi:hypothetical protein